MKPHADSGTPHAATATASPASPHGAADASQNRAVTPDQAGLPPAQKSRRANAPDFDTGKFRGVLSQFATGVTIITTRSPTGELTGLTASSFNSVSLSPPLILWSLANKSGSRPHFETNSHYVINVLSAEQVDLCLRFASASADRFDGIAYRLTPGGIPVLEGALAWFECHNRSRYVEGDHVIFVGEVERCGYNASDTDTDTQAAPLIFHRGGFHTLNPMD